MPRIKGSSSGGKRQPGRRITILADGSATGVSEYVMSKGEILSASPKLWDRHPEEPLLFVQQIDVEYLENDLARSTVRYFGLTANYDQNAGRDKDAIEVSGDLMEIPIQLHPKFASFAGSPESPNNNAIWVDRTTGERAKTSANAVFLDFGEGDFCGIKTYLSPYTTIRRNYKSRNAPNPPNPGKIVSSIPGFKGDGLGKFMCMGFSYREIGGIFHVTEEYKSGDFKEELYE